MTVAEISVHNMQNYAQLVEWREGGELFDAFTSSFAHSFTLPPSCFQNILVAFSHQHDINAALNT